MKTAKEVKNEIEHCNNVIGGLEENILYWKEQIEKERNEFLKSKGYSLLELRSGEAQQVYHPSLYHKLNRKLDSSCSVEEAYEYEINKEE